MKRLFILLTAVLVSSAAFSQKQTRHIVKLDDKATSVYSIDKPEKYLSEKALERRAKHNIAIDQRDLPISPEYVAEIQKSGYEITNRIKWLNTLIVKGSSRQSLEDFPFVKNVQTVTFHPDSGEEKDFFSAEKITDTPPPIKEEPLRENVYDYGDSYNQIAMLNGHLVHNQGYNGEGMTIAVLDAGFSKADELPAFDSLWANNQILDTRNFVNDEDVYSPSISNHGMNVLSTMGGFLPGELVGTAPKADYYLIRTEDASDEYLLEEYYWVDGSEYADSVGADIINSSLGYTNGFNDPDNNHTYEDMDGNTTPVTIGADVAAEKGILVVNSAGNSGNGSWLYIGGPADGDSVMAVGAVGANGNYVSFSSVGPTYDGRIKPNVAAKGASATVASYWGGITFASGTSFSSPITAGMVASVWQGLPGLSNMELIDLIQQNGDQANNPDTLLGYGIPDYAEVLNSVGTGLSQRDNPVLTIAPNPFKDYVLVKSGKNYERVFYQVIALNGRILREGSLYPKGNAFRINGLNDLTKGMYMLKVRFEDHSVSKKLMKH